MTVSRAPVLTGKQARHLRGLGHHLKPSVVVGREGVTGAVEAAVDEALSGAELIKVKLGHGCSAPRKDVAADLAARTTSAVAQVLGRTVLLYRPAKKPRIRLDGSAGGLTTP